MATVDPLVRIVAEAVQQSILDLFLSADVFPIDLDRDLVAVFGARNVIEDVLPVAPLKMKVLLAGDLYTEALFLC
jgi:hypothetical protein